MEKKRTAPRRSSPENRRRKLFGAVNEAKGVRFRRLRVEGLEDRSLLAVVVYFDSSTGHATVVDALTGTADITEESNDIGLNSSPTAGRLRVTNFSDGVIAGPGAIQIDSSTVDINATSTVDVDLQGGDDTVTIGDAFLAIATSTINTLNIAGGDPSGSDDLYLQAFSPASGAQTVTISHVNFGFNHDQLITGYAAGNVVINSRGYEAIYYLGNGGATPDDTLIVDTGDGDDTVRVQGGNSFDTVLSNSLPAIHFMGLNTFRLDVEFGLDVATFEINNLSGALAANYQVETSSGDTLVIEGVDTSFDNLVVTNPTGVPNVAVTTLSGTTVTEVGTSSGLGHLLLNTLGGDDTVTIDVTDEAGADNGTIAVPITFDGGLGSDTLVVQGNPAANGEAAVSAASYSPGPAAGEGRLFYDTGIPFVDMTIEFVDLEPIVDLVPAATLTVNGTNAGNAINYTLGANSGTALVGGATTGQVSVDGFETIEFANKGTLVLNGLAGSDTINLNNSSTPTGLTAITVNGGDPTAGSDTLIVNAISGATIDNFRIRPTAQGEGTIDPDLPTVPSVNYSGVEAIEAVLQYAEGDSFSLDGTTGDDLVWIVSGATPGFSTISGVMDTDNDTGFGPFALPAITVRNYNPVGAVGIFNFFGTGGLDDFEIHGTASNDTFDVLLSTRVVHSANGQTLNRFQFASGDEITLEGGEGDDTFNVPGNLADTLHVQGGNPSASDVLNFTGSGGNVVVQMSLRTVTEIGFPAVSFDGVELLNVNAGVGNIVVTGSSAEFDVTSTSPTAATITTNDLNLTLQTSNTGALTIDPFLVNTVNYHGRVTADNITVIYGAPTTVANAGLKTVSVTSNVDLLNILAKEDGDLIVLSGNASLVTTIVYGGDGLDTVNGSATTARFIAYGENSRDTLIGGSGNDVLIGGDSDDILTGGANGDRLEGGAGSDTLHGNAGADFLEGGDDADVIYSEGGGTGESDLIDGGGGDDILNFDNGAGNYVVEPFIGTEVTVSMSTGPAQTFADVRNVEEVSVGFTNDTGDFLVRDMSGTPVRQVNLGVTRDRNFVLGNFGLTGTITVLGSPAPDTITAATGALFSGFGGNLSIVDLAWGRVHFNPGAAGSDLVINGDEGDDVIRVEPTFPAGATTITLNGELGNDVLDGADNENGGDGDDTLKGASGNDSLNGGPGNDIYIPQGGQDTVTDPSGQDVILMTGTSGFDGFNIALLANGTDLAVTTNGLTTIYPAIAAAGTGIDRIIVQGLEGNDALTVNSTNGAIPRNIEFSGGGGNDNLFLLGGIATNNFYSVGPNPGQGTSSITIGNATQVVAFTEVEPVIDSVAGPLIVNATPADNAINFAGNVISVDNFETISLSNKTNVTTLAGAGSDTVNINNPSGLSGAVLVNGGDPTAGSDTLIVTGTSGNNTIGYSPTSSDAGSVTVSGQPTITFGTIEQVTIDGGGGADVLTITTPTGADEIILDPGALADEGTVTLSRGLPLGTSLAALSYSNLGSQGLLSFADTGGVRVDKLTINGRDFANASDAFGVSDAGLIESDVINGSLQSGLLLNMTTPGVAILSLQGLAGDDLFHIARNHPFTGGLFVNGGEPSASDVLNFNGTGAPIAVNLAARTIVGLNPVTFTAVEDVRVNANGGDVSVAVTANDDELIADPLSANRVRVELVGLGAVLNVGELDELTIDLLGGRDTLSVLGTPVAELIAVSGTQVTVDALKTVNYANAENLQVFGLAGNDTFNVTPATATTIFIDGGDPIGVTGDTVALTVPAAAGTITAQPGPDSDEGGFSFSGGGFQRVSYDHIEALAPIDVTASGGVVNIVATNADNDITILGVDADSLTVSIDGGPAIQYDGVTTLNVDALAGDDDIDVTVGPLTIAAINLTGGEPTAGSDTVVVTGTAGFDTLNISPLTFDSATVTGLGTPVNVDTAEHLIYNGQGGHDALTVTLPSLSDVDFIPGASENDASIRMFQIGVNNLLPLDYVDMGHLSPFTFAGAPMRFTLHGTAERDQFYLPGFAGTQVQVVDATLGSFRSPGINVSAGSFVNLVGHDGDDEFFVFGNAPFPLTVDGGNPSGSDVLFLTGAAATVETVTIRPDAANPTQQDITGLGGPIDVSGVELIRYTGTPAGSGAADDTLTVDTGRGDDTIRVQAAETPFPNAPPIGSDAVISSSLPRIEFKGLETFVLDVLVGLETATFATGNLNGANNYEMVSTPGDTLVIEGYDGASPVVGDVFTVTNPAGNAGDFLAVTHNNSTFGSVTVTNTTGGTAVGRLQINALGGNDTVTVDVNSPASDLIRSTGISFDGGLGLDQLVVQGTPATAVNEVIYSPGPDVSAGRLVYENAANTLLMSIEFTNLEPVVDLIPAATLTVDGTDGNNAINYSRGSVAANGLVTVDNYESIEFSNKTNLVINAAAGSDDIHLNIFTAPTALTTITANGGDPTGSDRLTYHLDPSILENLVLRHLGTGSGRFIDTSLATPNVVFGSVEHLTVVGQVQFGVGDNLQIEDTTGDDTFEYTPGPSPDAGTITGFRAGTGGFAFVPVDFRGMFSFVSAPADTTGGSDTLIVNGTAGNDVFTLDDSGPFSPLLSSLKINTGANNHAPILFSPEMRTLILRGLEGDDTFNVEYPLGQPPFTGAIQIEGGDPSASDVLNLTGAPATVENVHIAPVVGDTTKQEITGLGGPVTASGVELISYTGVDTDDTLTVDTGPSSDTVRVEGGIARDVVTSNSLPQIEFTALNTFALNVFDGVDTATFATAVLRGAVGSNYQVITSTGDTLIIEGVDTAAPFLGDNFTVTNPGGAVGDHLAVTHNTLVAVGPITVTNTAVGSAVGRLQINGLGGDDTFNVDVGGPGSDVIPLTPIEFNGGLGLNGLNVFGTPATPVDEVILSFGPSEAEGLLRYESAANARLMTIEFANLRNAVFDRVPAALMRVHGTSEDDVLSYRSSSVAGNGRVTVNDYEALEFRNKTNLILNGFGGSDEFSVNNTVTPAGLTSITVNGSDPTASDTLIVNATPDTGDNFRIQPTGQGAGLVDPDFGSAPTVSYTGIEDIEAVLQFGDDDSFALDGTAGDDFVQFFSTAEPGRATIQGLMNVTAGLPNASFTLPHITVQGNNPGGNIGIFNFFGAGGTDDFEFHGTSSNDTFDVSLLTRIALSANGQILNAIQVTGAAEITLEGGDGDDTFNIPGPSPILGGDILHINGGNPSASDVLNFTGSGGVLTLDLGSSTIDDAGIPGSPDVTYTGIEIINLDAGSEDLTIEATTGDDTLSVTPTGPNAVTANLDSSTPAIPDSPVINAFNILVLSVDLLAGSDNLIVYGTQGPETITVTGALVTVDPNGAAAPIPLETVNYTNTENLEVFAQAGDDKIDVFPSLTTTIFVDGGDPIGTTPGDCIEVHASTALFEPGPENDEGGIVPADDVLGPLQRISFDHIECVIFAVDCAIVLGTNGDDDITIIARDDSTHPVLVGQTPGVQDFTVVVNDGLELLFVDTAELHVDALAGDDDIVLREPAPNNAVWNVDVFIAGGPPAAPTGDQGDVFEYETPGTQTVIYSPNVPAGVGNATIENVTTSTVIVLAQFVDACPPLNYDSSPGGIEQIVYQGLGGGDTLTMNGTAQDDNFIVNPTNGGSGSHRSNLSPTFDYTGATLVTVTGGTGGFDYVTVLGTEGIDTVTTPSPTSVAFTGAGTVTLGTGLDRFDLLTFGSDDNVNLDLVYTGMQKVFDAGAGNDIVDLAGTDDATIFGGIGDDTLTGTPDPDLIFGGPGNDIIIGLAGNDQEYGEEGNDRFGDPAVRDPAANDAGNDQFFGGGGSDQFFWDPGDGDDLIEGGAGDSDQLFFAGNAGAEQFFLFADVQTPSRFHLFRVQAAIDIDAADLEEVNLTALAGTDTVTVGRSEAGVLADLSTTTVRTVDVSLGTDGAADNVFFNGRPLDDNLLVSVSAGIVKIAGLSYDLRLDGTDPADDRLTVQGNEGNDSIKAQPPVESSILITLEGGAGDDFLSADAILNGNEGDDFLEGGAGADTINGGSGNDTMIGRGGADTYDGGPGFDTILIEGTPDNDTINVAQTADTTLTYTVNAVTETDTLVLVAGVRTVEEARVEADAGADLIRVRHADALNDAILNSLRFTVHGDTEVAAGDRLIVVDDGTDDLTIYRKGQIDADGTVELGPGNAEPFHTVFTGIERAQFVDETGAAVNQGAGTGSRLVVFKHDPFEYNDDRFTATFLGANGAINVDPTIDPGPLLNPFGDGQNVPGDEDFYRVVAEATGTLDFQVYFTQVGPLASGRPGLPSSGNLEIQVTDASGDVIAGFGVNDATDNERIRIPAVAGQTYYLRVFAAGTAINNYSILVDNYAPPVPFDIELDDLPVNPDYVCPQVDPAAANSDTGRSHFDNITCDATPTIRFRLDDGIFLHDLPGNPVNDTPPDEVIVIPFQPGAGTPGYRIAIFDEGTPQQPGVLPQVPLGFATQVAEGVYEFTTPTLTDGSHFLSARVQMVDPATPQQTGFGDRSVSLEVVIDTIPPPAFFGLPDDPDDGLLPDSDTGVNPNQETLTDNVTSDTTPGFFGEAEADAVIRLFVDLNADGTANPDGTGDGIFDPDVDFQVGFDVAEPFDGNNQYPHGYWQVDAINFNLNAAPFPQDGQRTIFLTAEDVAGNINPADGVIRLDIFIDTQGPQVTDVTINGVVEFLGLTANNELVRFDSDSPNVIQSTIPVSNLAAGFTLQAIDVLPVPRGNVRPGTLFGLATNAAGTSARVYAILAASGAAAPIGGAFAVSASSGYGFDFNPTSGLLRIINSADDNIRFDVANGSVVFDTTLSAGDNVGAAYDRNDTDPETPTTLFDIDFTTDTLARQGGVNGSPSPNGGVITTIGPLGVDTDANVGFDIARGSNAAYASLRVDGASQLYTINLVTGQTDLVGTIGAGATIVGMTILPEYDLFDPKPSTDGPTPPVNSLVISFRDLPARTQAFLVEALKLDVADTPGIYRVIGDQNGLIPIVEIIVTNQPPMEGQPALATVELVFRDAGPDGVFNTSDDIGAPLPDDRFTLIVDDEIIDLAGNHLDGESNAAEPQEFPSFPTGDSLPGGDFIARFTIDSRPEIGNYSAGSAFIDINGNFFIDTPGDDDDYTNRDLSFQIGTVSDSLFAGKFEPASLALNDNDGFDKLGAYGYDNFEDEYRFLLDFDHDGAADLRIVSAFQVNAYAVAGEFAAAHPGDEIGLFDGDTWYLDTNGDNQLDLVIPSDMRGVPIVGDFNGDGSDDLATYDAGLNTYYFDTNRDGDADDSLPIGGPVNGFTELPVAGDLNLDGIDDLGIWVPNRQGSPTATTSEWNFLISDRINQSLPSDVFDPYAPTPLGNDVFAQFGDHFSLPIFGNFDPPVADSSVSGGLLTNTVNPFDVNNDGYVAPDDVLMVINQINSDRQPEVNYATMWTGPFMDVDGDEWVAPSDALEIINYLNAQTDPQPEAESAVDATIAQESESLANDATPDVMSDDLLILLASEAATSKKRP